MDQEKNPVRRAGLYRWNIILLSLVTMLSAAGALYLREQLRKAWDPGADSPYSSSKIEALKQQAAEREREEVLAEIRSSLEEGTTVSGMLREMFDTDIVVTGGGRYWFTPLDENAGLSSVQRGDIEIREDGTVRYAGTERGVSVVRGIDVSENNGDIDWERTAGDQLAFVMVHLGRGAADGTVEQDRRFARNAAGALQNGLAVGCYMEIDAEDPESIADQARFMAETLEPYVSRFTYPAALMVHLPEGHEDSAEELRKERSDALEKACAMLEEAGCTPVIGGDIAALSLYVDPLILRDREKWYTGFDETLYYPYHWMMWQYRAGGTVEGISGDVDLNIRLFREE